MDFELSEEQLQIKHSIREFAESEIKPHLMEWDEAQHFPEELRPKLAELGLMGVLFPEEYGGAGMGYVEYATIIEELGRVCGSVALSVAAHNSLSWGAYPAAETFSALSAFKNASTSAVGGGEAPVTLISAIIRAVSTNLRSLRE